MERNMTSPLFTTTITDRWMQAARAASADHDLTPIEIQRWEDDGGAVGPEVRPRTKPSLHRSTDCGVFAFHPASAERFRRETPAELTTVE